MEHRQRAAGEVKSQTADRKTERFRHLACLRGGSGGAGAQAVTTIREAVLRGDAVLVAVPMARAGPLREELGDEAGLAAFVDMAELGRNPGRIIPAVRAFAERNRGRRTTCVAEPVWAGRSPPELAEAARHEALLNLALAGLPVTALCLYDGTGLDQAAVASAELTHPELTGGRGTHPSRAYLGPGGLPPGCDAPLPAPPPAAELLGYRSDLAPVRGLVARAAGRAGLAGDRVMDLLIAVGELTANTLRHTTAGGTVTVWEAGGEVLCDVSDQGWITDPLAGRLRPDTGGSGGHGLWLVHQVCDLVETRTGPNGTTARLHLSLSA